MDSINCSLSNLKVEESSSSSSSIKDDVQVTFFTDLVDETTRHFQTIRFPKQIYAWIGCNSAKFEQLYAAAFTTPNNAVSASCVLGGASDNTGSGIARRLVLKTGLNIVLACNIPENSPTLEANAEKKLMEKLLSLGYASPKMKQLPL